MIWMWLAGAAFAGNVYLNGTFIDPVQVAGLEMEDVDVRIDPEGNLHITAPGYKVEVMTPPTPAAFGAPSPPQQAAAPAPSAGAYAGYSAPSPQPASGQYGAAPSSQPSQRYETAPASTANVPVAPVNPNGIAKASWWLVTEDNASGGHQIEVIINDQLAHSLRSGAPQQIVDVSAFLQKGSNQVVVKSSSAGASGGTLYVFLGPGSDQSGTVVMDKPEVQFGVGSSRTGAYQREYAIEVN
jgi:hypothetical protein